MVLDLSSERLSTPVRLRWRIHGVCPEPCMITKGRQCSAISQITIGTGSSVWQIVPPQQM